MSFLLLGVLTALSGSMLYPLLKNGFAPLQQPGFNTAEIPAQEDLQKPSSCDVVQCRQHHYPSCVAHVHCDDAGQLVASKDFVQGEALIHCPQESRRISAVLENVNWKWCLRCCVML